MTEHTKQPNDINLTAMLNKDLVDAKKHWAWEDKIFNRKGELIDVRKGYNLVVANCSVLLAGLMGLKFGTNAIRYWAMGTGSGTWDDQWETPSPPEPDYDDNLLVSELYRIPVTAANIEFVDDSNNVVAGPTNRIKVMVTIPESDGNGPWREFGLFGGPTASVSLNTGLMINHKLHKLLNKTSEISVQRTLIIEF